MDYLRPKSILEAVEAGAQPGMAYLAGGTDLILKIRSGTIKPAGLIDLQDVPGLDRIQVEGDWLEIGSMATFAGLLQNSLVEKNARALWLACRAWARPRFAIRQLSEGI